MYMHPSYPFPLCYYISNYVQQLVPIITEGVATCMSSRFALISGLNHHLLIFFGNIWSFLFDFGTKLTDISCFPQIQLFSKLERSDMYAITFRSLNEITTAKLHCWRFVEKFVIFICGIL